MKKLFSVIICAFFLMQFSVAAFAAENAEISFDTYSSDGNGNVCVDVNISENGDPAMLQFCVAYDSSVLDIVSVTTGDAFSGNSSPVINQIDGKIYFIWDSFQPLEDGGTMLHVEFSQKSNKETEVWIDETESFVVADSSFNDIGVIEGQAEIKAGSEIKPEPEKKPESENSSSQSKPASGSNNGINIDKNEVSVGVGEEVKVELEDAEDENVVWYSSNENVVKVDENGEIVPVAPGTATVTVTTEEGDKEATCVVTVTDDGVKTDYAESGEVEVLYSDKDEESVPGWVWAVIAVMVAAIAVVVVLLIKKIRNKQR